MKYEKRAGWIAIVVATILGGATLANDAFAGGGKGGSYPTDKTGTTGQTGQMGQQGSQVGTVYQVKDDGEIASVLKTANDIDIELANFAKDKTQNAEVRRFAEQMITDHTSTNKAAADLFARVNINPNDNELSRDMKQDADQFKAELRDLEGSKLDMMYIDHEIVFHQQVLDTIDNQLLPTAKNAELRNLVNNVRPTIKAHLDHAKRVRNSLVKAGA